MQIKLEDLAPFQEICRKICLNIPPTYCWQWDQKRGMAVVVLCGEETELVFFPLFKEFRHHWSFTTAPPDTEDISQWVNDRFGLMPGQAVFTSLPLHNLVLCVAWWPWGEDEKVSMRVGLIPIHGIKLRENVAFECLRRWLKIETPNPAK
ncbi:MAG: hypothetical protein HY911_03205 [Desulfobacterales bacterium]|nr:hypothetical protein [Desulfobacterales bacterium]MBI5896091.1 hypothetical protein [Desulfobacterales bacterium]